MISGAHRLLRAKTKVGGVSRTPLPLVPEQMWAAEQHRQA